MRRRESFDSAVGDNLCNFCYPSEDRDILYEDEDFYVMPSLGGFREGYLLLLSREHKECVSDIVNPRFKRIKEGIADTLDKVYGTHCFFEHGRVGNCYHRSKNRICFHAHLHCLPLPSGFADTVAEDFEAIEIHDISSLSDIRSSNPHYLYVETSTGKMVFPVENGIKRQYLRKKACEKLEIPTEYADWQTYPFRKRMANTAENLKDILQRNIQQHIGASGVA